jgi:hypothetical protein
MITSNHFTPLVITRLIILFTLLATLASLLINGFTNPVVTLFFVIFIFVAAISEFLPLTAEKWVFHKFPILRTHRPQTLACAALPLLWAPPRVAGVLMLCAAIASFIRTKVEGSQPLKDEPLEERIYQVL